MTVKTEGQTAINKTVTVTTNDPHQNQVILSLTAVVEPEFQLSERSVYFGSNPRGKEVVKEFIVTIPAAKPLEIKGIESTDQAVEVRYSPVEGTNGKKVRIVAAQKPDTKEGYHFGMIVIKTTSTLNPEVRVPIRGMVTPAP